MVKYRVKSFSRKLLFAITGFFSILAACSSTNSKPLLIGFSADSTSIVFSNIDRPGLLQLKSLKEKDSTLHDLISVLHAPSEKDSLTREAPVPGKILINENNVVFTPDRPFSKGSDYLIITFLNARFGTEEEILKSQLNTGVRPHQILLTR